MFLSLGPDGEGDDDVDGSLFIYPFSGWILRVLLEDDFSEQVAIFQRRFAVPKKNKFLKFGDGQL